MAATTLDELRMIAAVEQHGSLTAAAAALGVSQQAVSQRMRALERRWGLPLFERSARGTSLTAQGALVADWAGTLVEQTEAFESAVAALRSDRQAHVRVGASLTLAEHLVPGWLVTYAGQPGAARVELTALNSAQVIERVRAGTDDIGFIETPELPQGLCTAGVGMDEIVIVASPRHPWARRARVTAQDLAATPIVGRESGSGTRQTLEAALFALVGPDAVSEPAAELSTTAAIRATVIAGTGVAALSERAVRDDLDAGRLVRIAVEGLHMTRPLTAVWREDRPLATGADRILALATGAGERTPKKT